MRLAIAALVLVVAAPIYASSPGQPLDCSDWVADQPGYSCTTFLPAPCDTRFCRNGADYVHVMNDGALYEFRLREVATGVFCGSAGPFALNRLELVKFDGAVETVLFHFSDRCGSPGTVDRIRYRTSQTFDEENGLLYVPLNVYCEPGSGGSCAYPTDEYPDQGWDWLARIGGFTTEFEVLQTYTPQTSLAFRVPPMPEGLHGVDHFDTYYGALTKPLDFGQARGLRCAYPTLEPRPGDLMEIADTVPDPAPGQGVYYVTATTYQGETRYGRKTVGGRQHGRDPNAWPACQP